MNIAQSTEAPAYCTEKGICPGLGQGFYLPAINLLDAEKQTSGRQILNKTTIDECAEKKPFPTMDSNFSSWETSDTAIKSWSNSFNTKGSGINVPIGAFTLGATIDASFEKSTTTTADSKGIELNIIKSISVVDIKETADCWSKANLTDAFKDAFESLPLDDPKNAYQSSYWAKYISFLRAWGSHIQVKQVQGSYLRITESEKSSTKVTTTQMKTKACAKFASYVEACNTYDRNARDEASKLDIKENIYVFGGSAAARDALLADQSGGYDDKEIRDFVESAPNSTQPTSFQYKALWQLLNGQYDKECSDAVKLDPNNKTTHPACNNLQRVTNLEAAYDGFGAYGCVSNITAPSKAGGVGYFVAGMVAEPPDGLGTYHYVCKMAKTGCMTDNDCHNADYFWSTECYCDGPSCIGPALVPGTKQYKSVVTRTPKLKEGDGDRGIHASCPDTKNTCGCNTAWGVNNQGERELWSQALGGPGQGANDTPVAQNLAISVSTAANEDPADAEEQFNISVIIKEPIPGNHDKTERSKNLPETIVVTSADPLASIECPGKCTARFFKGADVTLVASAKNGALRFKRWSLNTCTNKRGTSRTCTLPKLNSSINLEVQYE
jgi:hypothetical protein